jgi:hypothetical protein
MPPIIKRQSITLSKGAAVKPNKTTIAIIGTTEIAVSLNLSKMFTYRLPPKSSENF